MLKRNGGNFGNNKERAPSHEMRATLRTLRVLASPSAKSYNRAYLASADASAQIPLRGTSDTLRRYMNLGKSKDK